MDAGSGDDQLAHESLTNVRLTKPTGERYTTTNHHPRTNTQIFHCSIIDGASRVVEKTSTPWGQDSFTAAVRSAAFL